MPDILTLQATVTLNGVCDRALVKNQCAVTALGFDMFAVDPDPLFGIYANGGDRAAGWADGYTVLVMPRRAMSARENPQPICPA